MTTLRALLKKAGFNPNRGRIIHQTTSNEDIPGKAKIVSARIIDWRDDILDREFELECKAPTCPRIVAEDERSFYFPSWINNHTEILTVFRDVMYYRDVEFPTPYPGLAEGR